MVQVPPLGRASGAIISPQSPPPIGRAAPRQPAGLIGGTAARVETWTASTARHAPSRAWLRPVAEAARWLGLVLAGQLARALLGQSFVLL